MPALFTHDIFARMVKAKLEVPAVTAVEQNPGCFLWGAQGPDFLFFSAFQGEFRLPRCGVQMHSKRIRQTFSYLHQLAFGVKSKQIKDMLLAYAAGYICHYVLDKNLHPYVYFLQNRIEQTSKKRIYGVHNRIESDIDSLLLKKVTGEHTLRAGFLPLLTDREKIVIARLYQSLLSAVYQMKTDVNQLNKAFTGTSKAVGFFFGNNRRRYRLIGFGETLFRRPGLLSSLIRLEKVDYDVLNLHHDDWYHQAAPEVFNTDSVIALIKAAGEEAAEKITQFLKPDFQSFSGEETFDNGRIRCADNRHS